VIAARRVVGFLCASLSIVLLAPATPAQQYEAGEEGTFSIIGRDPATGQLGMAVHSKTIAVGSRTRGGKGGVAVIAHQSASNPMYSILGVELLEKGEHVPGRGGIEVRGRLVSENDVGLTGQGAGDGHALLFAAAQFLGSCPELLRDAKPGEEGAGDVPAAGAGGPARDQRIGDVLPDR